MTDSGLGNRLDCKDLIRSAVDAVTDCAIAPRTKFVGQYAVVIVNVGWVACYGV